MIKEFQGEYRFLSNFWPCRVKYEHVIFPSVEHAYQAAKTLDYEQRIEFMVLTAGQAKRKGAQLELRPYWEQIKVKVMGELLRLKFQDPELREKLLATGEEELVEGNAWNDTFWGVCNGVGQNNLGKLLMQVRQEIREDKE